MQMQMHAASRHFTALAVIVIGLVAVYFAIIGDPGSSEETPRSSLADDKPVVINPVPLNPEPGPRPNEDSRGPLDDPTALFATSVGGNFEHKVKIKVSANGVAQVRIYYRDGNKTQQLAANDSFSTSRTLKGGYPLSVVIVKIPRDVPGRASRAKCTILIDGVKIESDTTTKPRSEAQCVG